MKYKSLVVFALLFLFGVVENAYSVDFKYVRTYDADGRVVKTAKIDEYISVIVSDLNLPGYSTKIIAFGEYKRFGGVGEWNYFPLSN